MFCMAPNQLRSLDITTVITDELELFQSELVLPTPELANVVESVMLLRYVELRSQIYRLLSVMKMRESAYDGSLREFRISPDGIDVAKSFESAESILNGLGRVREEPGTPRGATRRKRPKKGSKESKNPKDSKAAGKRPPSGKTRGWTSRGDR